MNRIILPLLLIALVWPALAGEPSTPEQRKRILRATRALEEDPFGDGAIVARALATKMVDEASDIKVRINVGMLRELMESKIPDHIPVFGQYILGQAAFVIEHPDLDGDETACVQAAYTSALRVYRKAVERDPANKIAFWETLSGHERSGTLKKHVEQLLVERKVAPEPKGRETEPI